jgi:hypothetical protein
METTSAHRSRLIFRSSGRTSVLTARRIKFRSRVWPIESSDGNLAAQNFDPRSGAYVARLDHRKIKLAPSAGCKTSNHVPPIRFQIWLIGRHARLRNGEHHRADLQTITDVHSLQEDSPREIGRALQALRNRFSNRRLL